MRDLLTYQVTVGAPVDHDVVSRQLTIVIDGVSEGTKFFDGFVTDFGVVEAPQDARVVLSVVDVDDAGNHSAPAVLEFVATDTLPPQAPGAVNVALVSERAAPEVQPEVQPTDESEQE